MRLKDTGDNKISPKIVAAVIGVLAVISVIVLIAILPNIKKAKPITQDQIVDAVIDNVLGQGQSNPDVVLAENGVGESGGITPSDLDFWDLYPEDKDESVVSDPAESTPSKPDEAEEDPATDGKHTLVTLRDGTQEWVLISQYLPKNDFDTTKLVCKDSEMQYFEEGKQTSFWGIDVSKYQDYIDYSKVRKFGVDFVMIRVGIRGYGTGQISLDDYFYDNIKRATDAGLKVGVYFSSQAITAEEAAEEAAFVLEAVKDYKLDYPIVFDMEFVKNDTARIEALSKDDKTAIAKTFLDAVSAAGYTGMIYGDKEWLIKEIEMSKLTAYDIWLAQPGDLPDYPYKFSIWQYKTNGTVDGVSGYVNLNVSFVDYSEK